MYRAVVVSLVAVALLVPAEAFARSLASPLPLMLAMRARGEVSPAWDWILPGIARDEVGLTIRLRVEPDRQLLAELAEAGAELRRGRDGELLHMGPVYSAMVRWESVAGLASMPAVERMELARPAALQSHLDVSVPEIRAPDAWAREDPYGRTLDGTGIVVGDFDSGIDVFHPLFFQADGGVFDWIDVDGDGRFDPGEDAVDLDDDGRADAGETLALLEGAFLQSGRSWLDGFYDPDVDWLYNDADGDDERSFGPEAGYTDLDPSFGELLFISLDSNGNGRLDPEEPLIGLGTSKLLATLVFPDTIRYRGVDLIETPVVDLAYEEYYGRDTRADHGTGVTSILAGGWSGSGRRITGVAPGAEIVLVDFNNEMGLAATLPWAISLGALAASHPYGHKLFSFLDGSSNEELAIDIAYEEHGAIQAVSVGNEANNRDDGTAEVPAAGDGSATMPFTVTHYGWLDTQISLVAITARWRPTDARLAFTVIDSDGNETALGSGPGGVARVGGASVDYSREDSPRGTAKFDIIISRPGGELPAGDWSLVVESDAAEPTFVVANLMNDRFRGGTGTSWSDEVADEMATVSAYATSDRAVGVCSYGTRHSYRDEEIGDISGFSSRGPRIDGFRIVDICAPGDNDIIWAASSRHSRPLGGYTYGGGTSASAPHVAGALALLQQAAPWASAPQVLEALYGGALVDDFVGEVPSHVWGAGKLRIDTALELLPEEGEALEEEAPDLSPWEEGLTPDAGLHLPPDPGAPLVGVEGGGCHCRAAVSGRRGPGSRTVVRAFFPSLWR